MKTIIAGSRNIDDYKIFLKIIYKSQIIKSTSFILSGGAYGIDALAIQFAKEHAIPYDIIPVTKRDWKIKGLSAGPIRNQEMLEKADRLICIWDGKSSGTFDMLDRWVQQKTDLCEIFIIHDNIRHVKDKFFDR